MKVRGAGRRLFAFAIIVGILIALPTPAGAPAASVVNGGFESGSLQGWQSVRTTEAGNWFAYKGSDEPIAKKRGDHLPQAPPSGAYAAVSDQLNPDTLVLYQDVALAPGQSHQLSLLAYYNSSKPIAVPNSGTLSVDSEALEGQANQQYRIDVIKPDAALDSVDPTDILRPVFRTVPGAAATMKPTRLSADLSPFAGQTVRLRFAVAAHEEVLTAGLDDVSISSETPGKGKASAGRASDWFRLGKLRLNRRNGTASLPVEVFGAGVLKATDARAAKPKPILAALSKTKKPPPSIRPVTAKAAGATTLTLRLKPTPSALATLKRRHKLRVKVAVAFTPSGERAVTTTVPVLLKLQAPSRR